jgi:hypothetical protein
LLAFIEPAREDGLERTLREMDYPPTTETLRENVRRQMEREAKRQLDRVNKGPGAAVEGAHREVVADALREEGQGHRPLPRSVSPGKLKLVWDNPHMTKATRRRTNHVALVMSE